MPAPFLDFVRPTDDDRKGRPASSDCTQLNRHSFTPNVSISKSAYLAEPFCIFELLLKRKQICRRLRSKGSQLYSCNN